MFRLLKQYDFYGVSETIEIAKGKYELPTDLKTGYKKLKRLVKWLTKR